MDIKSGFLLPHRGICPLIYLFDSSFQVHSGSFPGTQPLEVRVWEPLSVLFSAFSWFSLLFRSWLMSWASWSRCQGQVAHGAVLWAIILLHRQRVMKHWKRMRSISSFERKRTLLGKEKSFLMKQAHWILFILH